MGQPGDDIAERMLEFAARSVRAVESLTPSLASAHIARQLIRSATSAGANYEEARGAESRADFAHKVLVAAKETRESGYWLRLVLRLHLHAGQDLTPLVHESHQLVAILKASARTARSRA